VSRQSFSLGELAEHTGSRLQGNADTLIHTVATLEQAQPGALSFLANPRYRQALATTQASAVVVPDQIQLDNPPFSRLHNRNPYLAFAQIARLLNPLPVAEPGIDPSAVVHAQAQIAADAQIGPGVHIGADARIGRGCVIDAGAVIGESVVLGDHCRIGCNVSVLAAASLGQRVHIAAGAVIGSDGFGFAQADTHWEAVPQLGSVVLGDDVAIGANTTIDRGSQGDTVIEAGCKLDNLVQIAHNVHIGAHTVIAASSGISGSTRIGAHCALGGQVGIAGHLTIVDGCTFTGMTMVTGHVREPGVYSSGIPAAPNREWRRNAVRFGQLESMARRLDALEKQLNNAGERPDE